MCCVTSRCARQRCGSSGDSSCPTTEASPARFQPRSAPKHYFEGPRAPETKGSTPDHEMQCLYYFRFRMHLCIAAMSSAHCACRTVYTPPFRVKANVRTARRRPLAVPVRTAPAVAHGQCLHVPYRVHLPQHDAEPVEVHLQAAKYGLGETSGLWYPASRGLPGYPVWVA